ncbi:MAG: hypothetical protein J7494_14455 [Sphingobium sp.]|nr:hypothetical protein [Sphingobium sp.]
MDETIRLSGGSFRMGDRGHSPEEQPARRIPVESFLRNSHPLARRGTLSLRARRRLNMRAPSLLSCEVRRSPPVDHFAVETETRQP